MRRFHQHSVKGLQIATTNPCNDFIVEFMIRVKITIEKQVLRITYFYQLAIQAVRRYPMPLVCKEQLRNLQGFGQFFVEEVYKIIKKHYKRGRVATDQEKKEDHDEHIDQVTQNVQIMEKHISDRKNQIAAQLKQKRNNVEKSDLQSCQKMEDSESQEQMLQDDDQEQKNRIILTQTHKIKSQHPESSSIISDSSKASRKAPSRSYQPKPGTQQYTVLRVLLQLNALDTYVNRFAINEHLFNENKQWIKVWKGVKNKLLEHSYLSVCPGDENKVSLTQKGKEYVQKVEGQIRQKREKYRISEQAKVQKLIGKFKQNNYITEIYEDNLPSFAQNDVPKLIINSNEKFLSKEERETIIEGLNQVKIRVHDNKQEGKRRRVEKGKKKIVKQQEAISGSMNQQEKQINCSENNPQSKIKKQINLSYEEKPLKFGVFMWEICSILLNLIVIKLQAQDFDFDQYSLILSLAKATPCTSIVVWVNSPANQDSQPLSHKLKRRIMRFLIYARIQSFKIIQTRGIKQILPYLQLATEYMDEQIQSFFSKKLPLNFSLSLGNLSQFNNRFKFRNPTNLRKVTQNCWKTLSQCGFQSEEIMKKLPSLKMLYNQLQELENEKQRTKFMKWLCPNNKKGINLMIVHFFFKEKY